MAFGVVGGAMIPLVTYYRWVEMHAEPDDPLWEDDYSNPLKIVKWR